MSDHIPYHDKIEAAKRWLGDAYLLAHPINKPYEWRTENESTEDESSLA